MVQEGQRGSLKLSEFAGLDAKMEQLMRSAQAGRIVHALLFSGPRGSGKKTMANLFARAVLCESHGEKPCDVCPACKKCLGGTHPDVHIVAPEKNTIKVEQIRTLTEELSLAAYEGGKKIAIIERADRMNESAQNALLKTLENPTGDVLFMLLTDAPGTLLPTVVSRCLQLRFRCLEVEDCARVLRSRGVEAEQAQLLSALAQGSVGRALEISGDEGYLPLRDQLIRTLINLRKPEGLIQFSALMGESKDRESDILEILELLARDLMRLQNGVVPLEAKGVDQLAKIQLNGSALLRRVMLARQQLNANLSWANAMESMAFELAQEAL